MVRTLIDQTITQNNTVDLKLEFESKLLLIGYLDTLSFTDKVHRHGDCFVFVYHKSLYPQSLFKWCNKSPFVPLVFLMSSYCFELRE